MLGAFIRESYNQDTLMTLRRNKEEKADEELIILYDENIYKNAKGAATILSK